jgi:hypothetical protein
MNSGIIYVLLRPRLHPWVDPIPLVSFLLLNQPRDTAPLLFATLHLTNA